MVRSGHPLQPAARRPAPSVNVAHPTGKAQPCLLRTAALLLCLAAGCDHGLEPPDPPPFGTLAVEITYTGAWPPQDSLVDLRFVAFRFVPRDTADFFRLNELLFSETLPTYVDRHELVLDSVATGLFVYTVIAQRFSSTLTDWRPVGQYTENGGLYAIAPAETTRITIPVDFLNLPPFPPP